MEESKFNITNTSDILAIERDDISQSLFNYTFGNRVGKGSRFKVTQELIIPKGAYYDNAQPIKTSMGNYLINKALVNLNNYKVLGFINEKFDADKIHNIEKELSLALLNDKITTIDIIDFLNKLQFFGFALNSLMTPSLTEKTMFPLKEVIKRKKELEIKYKDELAKGDPVIASKMEKELLDLAKSIIKDDPGMGLFASGSKASFGNNYKLMNVMKGAISDSNGGFKISTTNYEEGVPREETDLFANSQIEAQFIKSVDGTVEGGYLVKKYLAAFQTAVLDDKDTDCGTTKTIKIKLTPFLKGILMYRNIKVGTKIVNLNENNINSYIGRDIELYDIIYCCSDKYCNKCAGNMYYKLGIKNIGTTTSRLGATVINKSMKKFHDNTIKIYSLENVDDLVI